MTRLQPRSWSLATRIFASVIVATAVICVVVITVSFATTESAMAAQAEGQVRTLAERSALAVAARLAPLEAIPGTIAAGQQRAEDPTRRIAQLEAALPAQLAQLPGVFAIYLSFERQVIPGRDYREVWFVRDGPQIRPEYSNVPGNPGYDPAEPLYDYHAMDWFTQPRDAGRTVWTEPYFDSGPNVSMVSAVTPVMSEGAFIGVAGVDISLGEVTALVDSTRPTARSYAFLVSRSGTFIANSQWPESVMVQTVGDLAGALGSADLTALGSAMTRGESGVLGIRDPRSGEPAWAGYEPVGDTGWSIAVIIPQADMLGALDALRQRMLGGSLVGLLALVGTLYLLSRSIVRPLADITRAAQRMAEGDLAARLGDEPGAELGTLAVTLNHLAESVHRSTGALERQRDLAELARADAEAARAQLAEQLATIGRQQELIRSMSVPVLPLSDSTLVMPLVGALDAARLAAAQEQALRALEQSRARWLLLDITGIAMIDSEVARGLVAMTRAARLLGGTVIIVGVSPEVAQAMVGLGIELSDVTSFPSLQSGLAYAR